MRQARGVKHVMIHRIPILHPAEDEVSKLSERMTIESESDTGVYVRLGMRIKHRGRGKW